MLCAYSAPKLPTQSTFKKLTVCLGPKMVLVVLKVTRYITVVQCLKDENDPKLKQGKAENKKLKYKPCFERKKEIPVLFEIENILLSSYKN